MVDSFREAYIPEQILKGQVLYKNIFTIYAPFSYLYNAFLYAIFGVNLNVLYFSALFTTLSIFNLTFFIAKRFMPKTYALFIVLFCIAVCVLSPNVFNFYFPYSYGMLYGLMFMLGSLLCILKKKNFWAFFLYSLAICNKYEFILFFPLLIYSSGIKHLIKNLLALMLPLVIVFSPLFIMGLELKDITLSIQFLMAMASSKTLYWFYSLSGLIFRFQLIPIYIGNLLKLIFPMLALRYIKTKWLYCVILVYSYFFINQEVLIFACPLILLLLIFNYSKLNKQKKIFIFGSLLVSMKIFYAITLQSYGVYFFPFVLISLYILTPTKLKKTLLITLIIFAISLGAKNIATLLQKNTLIQTNRGMIYATSDYGNSINDVINYVFKNTTTNEQVLIYPECLAVNFLTMRDSDNKFYSLIPLYIEIFSEDIIIKRFILTKPKHILINNYNTFLYYYSYFGKDYAGKIAEYIHNNYSQQDIIGKNLIFTPFIRN